MQKMKLVARPILFVCGAALVLASLALSGCSMMFPGPSSPFYTFPIETMMQVEAAPHEYKNTLLAFNGEVLWARRDPETGTTFQLWKHFSSTDQSASLVVHYPGDIPVIRGNRVDVLGHTGDRVVGVNAFGGYASAARFEAVVVMNHGGPTLDGISHAYWLESRGRDYAAWESGTLFDRYGMNRFDSVVVPDDSVLSAAEVATYEARLPAPE